MAACRDDFASERLAIELCRADVEAELQSSQMEARHAIITDQLTALDLQLQELLNLENTCAGQRMQQSLYTAMLADSLTISVQRRVEEQAIADRIAAGVAAGCDATAIPNQARQQLNSGNYDDGRLAQLEEAGMNSEAQTTFRRYVNALRQDEAQPAVDCVVCTNSFLPSQTITLQCGDTWCRGCMARRYEEATINEGVWPVRCCRIEIPLESVRNLLPLDTRTSFVQKSIEWADNDRTYCHEPSCATYLPHSTMTGRRAACSTCFRETCAGCKGPYHAQHPCPENNTSDDSLAEIARQNGWPRCPGCRHYVEITHGCNHMTCRCRTEFCYACEAIWKTCQCAQWDEERLLDRATGVAERQGRENIGEVAEDLVAQHNCTHNGGWERLSVQGRCDECDRFLVHFLYRCPDCHVDVCARCRFYRV